MGSRSRLSVSRSRRPEALSWFQKQFSATDLWRMPAFTKASDSRQLMLTKPKYGRSMILVFFIPFTLIRLVFRLRFVSCLGYVHAVGGREQARIRSSGFGVSLLRRC
eukprot:1394382-Amorphochlora_amoeboformis.AAC.1